MNIKFKNIESKIIFKKKIDRNWAKIMFKTLVLLSILLPIHCATSSFENVTRQTDSTLSQSAIYSYNFSVNFVVNKNYTKDYESTSNSNYKSLTTSLLIYVF